MASSPIMTHLAVDERDDHAWVKVVQRHEDGATERVILDEGWRQQVRGYARSELQRLERDTYRHGLTARSAARMMQRSGGGVGLAARGTGQRPPSGACGA